MPSSALAYVTPSLFARLHLPARDGQRRRGETRACLFFFG
jgi:hypothetical protein